MNDLATMPVDFESLVKACEQLKIHTEQGNDAFRELVCERVLEEGANAGELLFGLSQSTVKSMINGKKKNFKEIPQLLATIIFSVTGIDVTESKSVEVFSQLGFDIRLKMDVESGNPEQGQPDKHNLRNFSFEIHEANATAEDPTEPAFELDLRIGFDRIRMTVRAEELKVTSNEVCAETPREPSSGIPQDYTGWFHMRLADRRPLSWVFLPGTDGQVLKKRVDAPKLASIETKLGTPIAVELTVRREALKVRVVSENWIKPNKSMAESHREKMCAAIAKRSIAGSADEYVIFRRQILGSSS